MNKLKTYNLIFWLPFITLSVLLTFAVGNYFFRYHHHYQALIDESLLQSKNITFQLTQAISNERANNEYDDIRTIIASAPLNEHVSYAVIFDNNGNIDFASRLAWENQNITQVFPNHLTDKLTHHILTLDFETFEYEKQIHTIASIPWHDEQRYRNLYLNYQIENKVNGISVHVLQDMIPEFIFIITAGLLILFINHKMVRLPLRELHGLAGRIKKHDRNIENPLSGNNDLVAVGDALASAGQKLIEDITSLSDRENRLSITLNSIADGVIVTNAQGKIERMNPTAEAMTGWKISEAIHNNVDKVFNIFSMEGDSVNPVEQVLSSGDNVELHNHTMLQSADGEQYPIFQTAAPIFVSSQLVGVILVFQNVAKEYQLRAQLNHNIHFLENLMKITPSVTFTLESSLDSNNNNHFQFSYISPSISRYTAGKPELWVNDKNIWEVRIHPEDMYTVKLMLIDVRKHPGVVVSEEIRFLNDNSEYQYFQVFFVVSQENTQQIIGVATDITEQKQAEEKVSFLAFHDVLTGLPNRAQLDKQLEQAISRCKRKDEQFALLYLDLDRFKLINDTLGHNMGDQLLVEVAHRLKAHVRVEDTISRAGGDEFTVLLLDTDSTKAAHAAQNILAAIAEPYDINENILHITVAIGISMYPENGETATTLKQKADNAMYRAKAIERNIYQFFTDEMHDQMLHRMHIENLLHLAIERNEFTLVYQPQFDVNSNTIIGAEALLRWHHSQLGFISPADFIPIAEESGLISKIGDWVLNEAFAQLQQWQKSIKSPFVVAINLSAVQFMNSNLADDIAKLLSKYQLNADDIELEITETTAAEDLPHTIKQMQALSKAGVQFSLDDFGTGFSSLHSLKKLPIKTLKIDKSFVDDVLVDKDDEAIIDAIITLAKTLDLMTIAEGVETQEQLEVLKEKGCHNIQGYLLSRPIPAEELLKLLISSQGSA